LRRFIGLLPIGPDAAEGLYRQAHVCQTTGDSIRLPQALAGKGVMPLSG
jgi:hypothetical protein